MNLCLSNLCILNFNIFIIPLRAIQNVDEHVVVVVLCSIKGPVHAKLKRAV